jgi:aldose 1-epimerase
MNTGARAAITPVSQDGAVSSSMAMAVRARFGMLADGTAIEGVTLGNANGTTAVVITLGATLQALHVADRNGEMADVVLGYDDAASYFERPQYFGATIGRCANRIAGARFDLDGDTHLLEANDGPNHLHGGAAGFDRRVWTIEAIEQVPEAKVVMTLACADGEGGYPGALSVTATYSLSDADALSIAYEATTTRPTIVNITNHSFFNLGGCGDVMDHRLTLHAARYTPVDETLIPTGALPSVAGAPFDFRRSTPVGARIRDARDAQLTIGRGYDHHFVIDGAAGQLRPAARLEHEASGRVMDLLVTAPGVQFYSGNFLDGSVTGKKGCSYRQGDGLCLEPQAYPDAANQPHFPSVRLDPGETYSNRMVLCFSTAPNPSAGSNR